MKLLVSLLAIVAVMALTTLAVADDRADAKKALEAGVQKVVNVQITVDQPVAVTVCGPQGCSVQYLPSSSTMRGTSPGTVTYFTAPVEYTSGPCSFPDSGCSGANSLKGCGMFP